MKVFAVAICVLLLVAPRTYAQGWTGRLIDQLVSVAESAPAEGLPFESGRLERLSELRRMKAAHPAGIAAYEIDAEASALFARLATDFTTGRVNPAAVDPSWHILPTPPDTDALQAQALASGDVAGTLTALLPQHAEYRALKSEYARVLSEPDQPEQGRLLRGVRLAKLRAALERWRWLPHPMPQDRIEVHVPEFHLVLMQGDTVLRTHKVVVGKTTTRTPTFSTSIDAVIFNPYWVPPASILHAEIVPKLRRDPTYAKREEFEILGMNGRPVDAATIDWAKDAARYHIRQMPGEKNALGHSKFDMPNPYGIYLHDTPALSLFDRLKRTFSHGCIRVQNALTLARVLLGADVSDLDVMDFALASQSEIKVPLSQPLPIFVLYLTAATDESGKITYVDDVYKRDKALIAALDAATAAAHASPQSEAF